MERNRDEGMFADSLSGKQMRKLDDSLLTGSTQQLQDPIIQFVTTHRPGKVIKLHDPVTGTYKAVWRLDFQDGGSVCFRVPKPGSVSFPDEKTRVEAATLCYIAEKTSIPVPRLYHWGTARENPTGLGAFIIMDYIRHETTLNEVLGNELEDHLYEMEKENNFSPENYTPTKKIVYAYRQMASIYLQLSKLEMPRLGSLTPKGNGSSFEVATRPLPQDINDLPCSGGFPRHMLPPEDKIYTSSHEWYSVLADRHISHLVFQHNDTILSEDDCRDKFVARYLFRRLIRDRRYPQALDASASEPEVFKFWCDDLRPNSVLVDKDLKVVGVIDWEWSYFAPQSFAYDPPWWLMICKPDFDVIGFDSWCERYPLYLDVFLKILAEEECSQNETILKGTQAKPLSVHMRENWDSGAFWVNNAARKPYSFEPMFWKMIDERFYGPNKRGGYEDRLALVPESARRRIEWLVKRKMKEDQDYRLVDWTHDNAKAYVRAVLSSFS